MSLMKLRQVKKTQKKHTKTHTHKKKHNHNDDGVKMTALATKLCSRSFFPWRYFHEKLFSSLFYLSYHNDDGINMTLMLRTTNK